MSAAPVTACDTGFQPERAPFLWLTERELLRFLRIWPLTVVGPVLSSVLFVVVFGLALSRHVDAVGGISYATFIVPGLFAQTVVTVGFMNGTGSLFEARKDKYIHDVFASPLRWWEINAALVIGGIARGAIVGAGVLVTALPLVHLTTVARPGVLALGTLGLLLAASQIGVIAGSLARSLDGMFAMNTLVLLPLTFLGGVFYSVRQLPPVWNAVSRFDPVFWVVQVERIGFLGRGDVSAGAALGVVWAIAIGLSAWTAYIFGTDRLKA